ncbi:MAG: type II secretion system GspH family protein [Phycisphaerae bacterium]|nr:type II secretion system GspH family protein [Phycisphaerae bacterium]
MRHRAFTLIELLVVIGILIVLLAIMLPAMSRAREQAKVTCVNAELRQIGLCLDMYMQANEGKHPPTRQDCGMGWEDHQLPPELVDGGYLAKPVQGSGMSVGIEDRYNRGNTYRYWAVGELVQNSLYVPDKYARLYVPKGFPDWEGDPEEDLYYDTPKTSPVTWVVYSQGPNYDPWDLIKIKHGPVPQRCWYDPRTRQGLIVRMRLNTGRHIGSFQGYGAVSKEH